MSTTLDLSADGDRHVPCDQWFVFVDEEPAEVYDAEEARLDILYRDMEIEEEDRRRERI